MGFSRTLVEHPGYDAFWRDQAVDRVLAAQPVKVPTMVVHGQQIRDGGSLGALKFNSNTALYFRQEILRPFLDQYLKDGAPKADLAPVTAFETGTNTWRRLPGWPTGCASGCTIRSTPLYLTTGLGLSFEAPDTEGAAYAEYVSDP